MIYFFFVYVLWGWCLGWCEDSGLYYYNNFYLQFIEIFGVFLNEVVLQLFLEVLRSIEKNSYIEV